MDYAAARLNMVDNQIRTNRVVDSGVLEAMLAVPREQFVPKQLRGIAYVDESIDLGNGRYLLEPLVLARLLQLAEIKETDVALVVGCNTGYSAALTSKLASSVVALESDEDLAKRAGGLLSELGCDSVAVVTGPLRDGYAQQGPYDVILIDGGVQEVPEALRDQLAEGGRLVSVIMGQGRLALGHVVLTTRLGEVFSHRDAYDAAAPLLPGFAKDPGFVF